jgi:hypothetical protein
MLGSNVECMQKKEMYTLKAHACVYKPRWDRVLRSPALDCNFRVWIKLHPVWRYVPVIFHNKARNSFFFWSINQGLALCLAARLMCVLTIDVP